MKRLILNSIFFLIVLIGLISSCVVLADPYDFYPSLNLSYDRINKIRKLNTCLFSLGQIESYTDDLRKNVQIITIGNSQAEHIRGGYTTGASGRYYKYNEFTIFDLSFGGATNYEVIDLLSQQSGQFDNLEKVFIVFNFFNNRKTSRVYRSIEIINNKFKNYLLNSFYFRESLELIYDFIIHVESRKERRDYRNFEKFNYRPEPLINKDVDYDLIEKTINQLNKEELESVLENLNPLIDRMSESNVEVIVVIPPLHPELFNLMMTHKNSEYKYFKSGLNQKSKFVDLNYMHNTYNLYFADKFHLAYPNGNILLNELLNIKTNSKKQVISINKALNYWESLKQELSLSKNQLRQLKSIRRNYENRLKKDPDLKNDLLRERSKKEIVVLGSHAKKNDFNKFNIQWKVVSVK